MRGPVLPGVGSVDVLFAQAVAAPLGGGVDQLRGGGLLTDQHTQRGSIIAFDDLEHTEHAHEFVGAEHSDVPFSIILVHSQPGVGPKLHRHTYAEVFVVESGQATFQVGDQTVVVDAGHVVVSPPGEAHSFTNTGTEELRVTAIHGAGRFDTEWLSGADPIWSSKLGA
jgi:mannose-6-phosphate isomerase-like protein (cupin superfamily)